MCCYYLWKQDELLKTRHRNGVHKYKRTFKLSELYTDLPLSQHSFSKKFCEIVFAIIYMCEYGYNRPVN